MTSREYIAGFFMGFGLSSLCHGLIMMYYGNKLIQLNKTMNELYIIHDSDNDVNVVDDNVVDDNVVDDNVVDVSNDID